MKIPITGWSGGAVYELRPSKIVAIGRNYRAHAAELGNDPDAEPVFFLKPPSSLIALEAPIRRPDEERVDYEGELALVMGKGGANIPRDRALDHVLAWTCANDVTCRTLQSKGGPWSRAKGYDTFCPVGPRLVCDLDPSDLAIETRLSGRVVQSARTRDMVFSPQRIIEFVSSVMTLEEGDLILTGTPAGVGNLRVGDTVAVEIEGIGVLENPVVGW